MHDFSIHDLVETLELQVSWKYVHMKIFLSMMGNLFVWQKVLQNIALPEKGYGSAGNNYQGQKWPKLAKYFK